MLRHLISRGIAALAAGSLLLGSGGSVAPSLIAFPRFVEAPEDTTSADAGTFACTTPGSSYEPAGHHYRYFHCYSPSDIYAAYGIDKVQDASNPASLGAGQTIVLVDAYGSPTAANDLNFFHDTYFSSLPAPNFEQVFPDGQPDYNNIAVGNGLSGPNGAAGWAGEATLDIEWAYAMAPLAHIVLVATNPAETLGVQGLPNMFKGIRQAIDKYPSGTVFSQSFGTAEQNFGGAMATQQASYDETYKYGLAKGDTFVASSGDSGSGGADKIHKESGTFPYQVTGYPGSSPYNLTVGGTQLMSGWTWAPTSTAARLPTGRLNPAFFNSTSTPGSITEPVWKESFLGGNDTSSGGASAVYPSPSWQSAQAGLTGGKRGVPDVSWAAAVNGGVLIYITAYPNAIRPGWHVSGGTSAGSPQIAGLLAVANALRSQAGKAPLGDPHAAVYALGNGADAATYYRDVTPQTFGTVNFPLVDNQWDGTPTVPGRPVTGGWDMTTGFGSPHVDAWIPALAGS